jgi:hypothetical protein
LNRKGGIESAGKGSLKRLEHTGRFPVAEPIVENFVHILAIRLATAPGGQVVEYLSGIEFFERFHIFW